jgi:adenylate cyclase
MVQLTKIAKLIAKKAMRLLAHVPAAKVDGAIAAVVTAVALGVYAFVGLGQNSRAGFSFIRYIEMRSLDARFQLRGQRDHDSRIVIVGMDEKTLQKTGYPIPRHAYADMVDRLHAAGAKIIAFDVDFTTPETNRALDALNTVEHNLGEHPAPDVVAKIKDVRDRVDDDALLGKSIQSAGNVVLGHLFLDQEQAKSIDAAKEDAYVWTLADHPFPQVRKIPPGASFDMNKAWRERGGAVQYAVEPNIPSLAEAAKSFGHFNQVLDADGTLRRSQLLVRMHYQDQDIDFYPSLPLEVLRQYENISNDNSVARIASDGMERIEVGSHVIRTNPDGTVLINFAGPYLTYPHYSMADVIDGKFDPGAFKDKIVLVGATAIALGDMRITPFQNAAVAYMGVEIHANVLDNLLNSNVRGQGFLSRGFREEIIDICVILLFGIGGWVIFAKTSPSRAAVGVVAILSSFSAAAFIVFAAFGMWLYVVIPAMSVVVDYAAITSYRMIFEEREKKKVRKTFERYVAPAVIRLIEEDPEKYLRTGGEMRELTVMFSDIRDFTSIAEGLTADELVHLLNRYLGDMTGEVFHTWGTLDKYIGDAIMAFWGSPVPQADHAYRACDCALRMSEHLEHLNDRLKAEGKKTLKIGIGVNSGPMNVGNMGSEYRFAWTVMGDNVNLASRLEGQTKSYKAQRLISESTYEHVKEQMVCRQLDVIRVQGKQKPVAIYELLDFSRNKDQYEDLLARFNAARDAYVRQAWSEAVSLFEGLLERYPDDGPSVVLLDRCREFRVSPPSGDWDGVYTTKKEAVH